MEFLLSVICLVISTSRAAECPPGEYKNNDLCCPMCNVGTVVKTHCTLNSSSNVCVPCVTGTFMDHPNGLSKCHKCTECDTGAGLLEIKRCTYSSDAECDCRAGYYCAGGNAPCDLCVQHSLCNPGQYLREQGTTRTDNVCAACPPGHFSNRSMSQICTAWTDCDALDRIQSIEGSVTSDAVCVNKRKHYGVIAPFLGIFVIFLLFLFNQFCGSSIFQTRIVTVIPPLHEEYYRRPTEETGTTAAAIS
ncbi:tumor necrosis factor receptor superfamily member 5-like [Mantella aurantiaca]